LDVVEEDEEEEEVLPTNLAVKAAAGRKPPKLLNKIDILS